MILANYLDVAVIDTSKVRIYEEKKEYLSIQTLLFEVSKKVQDTLWGKSYKDVSS